MNYQKDHLHAIQQFYHEVNQKNSRQFSLSDVIIAWFTEGHAESFRRQFMKQKKVVTS